MKGGKTLRGGDKRTKQGPGKRKRKETIRGPGKKRNNAAGGTSLQERWRGRRECERWKKKDKGEKMIDGLSRRSKDRNTNQEKKQSVKKRSRNDEGRRWVGGEDEEVGKIILIALDLWCRAASHAPFQSVNDYPHTLDGAHAGLAGVFLCLLFLFITLL